MRVVTALLCASALAPLLLACGGGNGSFPEPAECVSPQPLPTSSRHPGSIGVNTYESAMDDGLRRLVMFLLDFQGAWPSGNFSRQSAFRTDFANYSDRTRCLATYLRDLPAPSPEHEEADAKVDSALDGLLAHTEFGREAVRRRNVSEWRDWRDGVDVRIDAFRAAIQGFE